jgi:hypothetical protein
MKNGERLLLAFVSAGLIYFSIENMRLKKENDSLKETIIELGHRP